MENNKTFTTMTQVTLTPAELGDIIDNAFNLGKVYAADELSSAGYEVPTNHKGGFLGTHAFLQEWNKHIEKQGGDALNSGDAKLDILFDACTNGLRDQLSKHVAY